MRSSLLEHDLTPVVKEGNDRSVVEAVLIVGAKGDVEGGGKLAHGVVVAPQKRPPVEIEA